jgi:DNA-directed RNA polymerase subunit RPC12/RpoP
MSEFRCEKCGKSYLRLELNKRPLTLTCVNCGHSWSVPCKDAGDK